MARLALAGLEGEGTGAGGCGRERDGISGRSPSGVCGYGRLALHDDERRLGERATDAERVQPRADGADEERAGVGPGDDEAGNRHLFTGADAGARREIAESARLGGVHFVSFHERDAGRAVERGDGSGVGTGRKRNQQGGVGTAAGEGEGADASGGIGERGGIGGGAAVPAAIGGHDRAVATAQGELHASQRRGYTKRCEAGADAAQQDAFRRDAVDDEAGDEGGVAGAGVGAGGEIGEAGSRQRYAHDGGRGTGANGKRLLKGLAVEVDGDEVVAVEAAPAPRALGVRRAVGARPPLVEDEGLVGAGVGLLGPVRAIHGGLGYPMRGLPKPPRLKTDDR